MVYNWLKKILLNSTSKHCLLCLSPTFSQYLLCSDCENDLPGNRTHCIICSSPFASHVLSDSLICGKCQKAPPHYTTSFIPHLYASPLKELICQLKFHGNLCYAPLLARNFMRSLEHRKNNLPECIIPMPLHQKRLVERGFNQAVEISKIISKKIHVPIDYSLCHRTKYTPFQSGLSAKQRKLNLKNAFNISNTKSYQHVAIFDDVVTTGTSVDELAKKLKLSGVKIVEVWALARTEDKNMS